MPKAWGKLIYVIMHFGVLKFFLERIAWGKSKSKLKWWVISPRTEVYSLHVCVSVLIFLFEPMFVQGCNFILIEWYSNSFCFYLESQCAPLLSLLCPWSWLFHLCWHHIATTIVTNSSPSSCSTGKDAT